MGSQEPVVFEPIRIVGIIEEDVGMPRGDGTPGSDLYRIPFRLSRQPPAEWVPFFNEAWRNPPVYSSMHQVSIAKLAGDRIILDRTTMFAVEQAHKETLVLCVTQANDRYVAAQAQAEAREKAQRQAEKERTIRHKQEVAEVVNRIRFD